MLWKVLGEFVTENHTNSTGPTEYVMSPIVAVIQAVVKLAGRNVISSSFFLMIQESKNVKLTA